jgi:hypothetical protein
VEQDVLHVRRVMRTTVVQCLPEVMLVGYWRIRLEKLAATRGLTTSQLLAINGMLDELLELDAKIGQRQSSG